MNQVHPQTASTESKQPDNYEKGAAFEQYIIDLFNKQNFTVNKWRKAQKDREGFNSYDYSYPDLEMVFGRGKYRFAVECKWRKEFKNNKIDWAKDNQIDAYHDCQNRHRIPVFIAIGIGGEPDCPERLYVTPLSHISRFTDVYESHLLPFNRNPKQRFYFDTKQLELF